MVKLINFLNIFVQWFFIRLAVDECRNFFLVYPMKPLAKKEYIQKLVDDKKIKHKRLNKRFKEKRLIFRDDNFTVEVIPVKGILRINDINYSLAFFKDMSNKYTARFNKGKIIRHLSQTNLTQFN